jgi:hypothetical protein
LRPAIGVISNSIQYEENKSGRIIFIWRFIMVNLVILVVARIFATSLLLWRLEIWVLGHAGA